MLNLSFVYCEALVQSIETPVTMHHYTVSGGDLPGIKPKEPDGDSTFLSSSLFKQEIPQCFHVMSKNRVACTLVSGIGNYSLYNISWVWMRQTPHHTDHEECLDLTGPELIIQPLTEVFVNAEYQYWTTESIQL